MATARHPGQKLLSIITASNRPHNMRGFLENLNQTVDNRNCFELLVKIDEGDDVMLALMEEAVNTYDFEIRFIQTPRLDGYYTLHHGYQQLFEMSDKQTYFIFPVNEEVRFRTQGWDSILATYVKLYDDDFFRLKISRLKHRNYYTVHDCGPTPENYPFMTRKWMELAGGIGDCWGPDGWHQYIDYHLGLMEGINGIPGIFRSIPINDILISGEEAGKELKPETIRIRSHRIFQEWWRMYRTEAQQEFRRIAVRMMAYVWAKNENLKSFDVIDNRKIKSFSVRDKSDNEIKKVFYYHLSATYIRMENFRFLIKMARRNSIGSLKAYMDPSYGPKRGPLRLLNVLARTLLVLLAIVLSFITTGNESVPKLTFKRFFIRMKNVTSFIYHKGIDALSRNVQAAGQGEALNNVVGGFPKMMVVLRMFGTNLRIGLVHRLRVIAHHFGSILHHIKSIVLNIIAIFKNIIAILINLLPTIVRKTLRQLKILLLGKKEKKEW